jgi:signal transduction histidine kinase
MNHHNLPDESVLRVELEIGQRLAVAGIFQILAFVFYRAFVPQPPLVSMAIDFVGAVMGASMVARGGLFLWQRRAYPSSEARQRWKPLFRAIMCVGGGSWGVIAALTLSAHGVDYAFFIVLIINMGIAAISVQAFGIDLTLVRSFVPLILGPPIVLAVERWQEPGHAALALLLGLFLGYLMFLAKNAHNLLFDALENRHLVEMQKDQIAAVIESMPGYLLWTDLEGRVLGSNERYAAASAGNSPAELFDPVRRFVASGLDQDIAEQEISLPNGKRPHLVAMRRYRSGEGDRVVVSALDIEEQKHAERQLESVRAQAHESARLAGLGTMAGGIAHEINNPLQVLRNVGVLLRHQLASTPEIADRCARLLTMLNQTVDRMATIIAGLRSFARDGADDPVETVNVPELIDEVVELAHTSRAIEDTRLQVDPVPPGLEIECKRTEIGQVLLNLINNAYDAVQGLPDRWVRLAVEDAGREVQLSVIDSGAGIAPELVPKIMLPFFTTKAGSGTGLGLPISRSIVERHCGTLMLDGTSRHTRFVVRLPKSRPTVAVAAAASLS